MMKSTTTGRTGVLSGRRADCPSRCGTLYLEPRRRRAGRRGGGCSDVLGGHRIQRSTGIFCLTIEVVIFVHHVLLFFTVFFSFSSRHCHTFVRPSHSIAYNDIAMYLYHTRPFCSPTHRDSSKFLSLSDRVLRKARW